MSTQGLLLETVSPEELAQLAHCCSNLGKPQSPHRLDVGISFFKGSPEGGAISLCFFDRNISVLLILYTKVGGGGGILKKQ